MKAKAFKDMDELRELYNEKMFQKESVEFQIMHPFSLEVFVKNMKRNRVWAKKIQDSALERIME